MNTLPYPEALKDAGVTLSRMTDGQKEGLVVGNGDLYGLVWEKDGGLIVRITKNDIWDARVDSSKDQPLPKADVRTGTITGSTGAPPSYKNVFPQPRCAVAVRLGAVQPAKPVDAQGTLDLQRAVATVTTAEGGKAQVRVLADRNVLLLLTGEAVRLEEIVAETLPAAETGTAGNVEWLHMKLPGDIDYKGMEYCAAVAGDGNVKAVSLVTSFDIKTGNVKEAAIELARKTLAEVIQSREKVIAGHEAVWNGYWSRSGIELADTDMQRWWYRILYFARTISQPGGRYPVGLVPPLVTDSTPWHADFHFNYNSWQPFWSVISPNHPELADPWIEYVHSLLPRAQWQAREIFGCDGVYYAISQFLHEPDPAACKSVNKRSLQMAPWGMTIGMVGMTAQNLWHKHLCDPDRGYLETKIYPTLREAAKFYLSFAKQCAKDGSGKIMLGPSYSPEHGELGITNCPFDIAYAQYTFDAFDKASKELGKDRDLAAECLAVKAFLADYPVAADATGMPVVVDWAGCKYQQVPQHNIEVPASPVFPCEQVTWFSPEPVKELFRRTIKDTKQCGGNSHIMFNIAKARLSMPEGLKDGRDFFKSSELANGLFIFHDFGHLTYMAESIGVVALVTEFLMQSVGDIIRVFPCWPKEQDAKFNNMRAQGGFLVSAEQIDGNVAKIEITSTVGGKLRLLSPWLGIQIDGKPLKPDAGGVVEVETKAGQRLTLSRAGKPLCY